MGQSAPRLGLPRLWSNTVAWTCYRAFSLATATAITAWLLFVAGRDGLGGIGRHALIVSAVTAPFAALTFLLVRRRPRTRAGRPELVAGVADADALARDIALSAQHAEFGALAGLIAVDFAPPPRLGPQHVEMLATVIGMRVRAGTRRGDCVARLSGTRFAVLQKLVRSRDECEALAVRLRRILSEPFLIEGESLNPICRVEVRSIVNHAADVRSYLATLERPDDGLGSASCANVMETSCPGRHYKPIVDVRSGNIVGYEAVAELTGPDALRRACLDAASWPIRIRLMVRIARLPDEADLFGRDVHAALDAAALSAQRLEISLDEQSIGCATADMIRVLGTLRRSGVRISIGDFGSTHASLTALTAMPFDGVKLADKVVSSISETPDTWTLARSIISAAHAIGVPVHADGVDSLAQLGALSRLGCIEMQGSVVFGPLPFTDLVHETVESDCRTRLAAHVA